VIVDYRPGAGIRLSPHFYNTDADIEHAMDVLEDIVHPAAAAATRSQELSQETRSAGGPDLL
jgi:hypothetical protein